MKSPKTYDDLSPMAQGYADAILETNAFWPDEDRKEILKWESRGTEHFTPDACASIAAACEDALAVLSAELGGKQEVIRTFDGKWGELGESLWHCRQGSGHEPDFGNDKADAAVMDTSTEIGEAYVELGRGRICHSDHAQASAGEYFASWQNDAISEG